MQYGVTLTGLPRSLASCTSRLLGTILGRIAPATAMPFPNGPMLITNCIFSQKISFR
jgi:hypothetical protein